VIKSRRRKMGGACDTYGGEERRCTCSGNLKERDIWKNLGVAGRVILKWKSAAGTWTGVTWLWIGRSGGLL